jgi:transposase-like protein
MRYPAKRAASLPDGSALATLRLPFAEPARWTAQRKEEVVIAVHQGHLGLAEACRRHKISAMEFLEWEQRYEREGLAGLKAKARTKRPSDPLQSPAGPDALDVT